jgi:hypothetical protein
VKKLTAVLGLALLIALATAGAAGASKGQESWFMDDNEITRGSDPEVQATMAVLASLGVDRVRVSVFWNAVAPDPKGHARPAFGAGGEADPAAYPPGSWNRYDRIVLAAQRYRVAVHFTLTGPGPVWASSHPERDQPMLEPNPSDFRDFVTAVGRRYSGTYADEQPQPAPEPGGLPIVSPPPSQPPPPSPTTALPRVNSWSTWNEPNQPGWLRPQWGAHRLPISPRLYRGLQDAAYEGLARSGHGSDTYLLGETAPRGGAGRISLTPMRPLVFIRDLYCVNRKLRPYTGRAAAGRGCPTTRAGRRGFAHDHPGLFRATGWAHHPYALEVPPQVRDRARDQVTLSTLDRLARTLDRTFLRYGQRRRLPFWLSEYGYQTNPPDTFIGVSWRKQADYLGRAENITARNGRVKALTQFLLVDDAPNTTVPRSSVKYWGSTFQSGLITREGRRKDAFFSYQRSFDITPRLARTGTRLRVFGQLRPAAAGARLAGTIEFRRRGSRKFKRVGSFHTSSQRNSFVGRVRTRASGYWRVSWRNPAGGAPLRSIELYVEVARKKRRR